MRKTPDSGLVVPLKPFLAALTGIALLYDWRIVYLYIEEAISLQELAALHGLLVAVIAALVAIGHWRGIDLGLPSFLLIATTFLGPMGLAGFLVTIGVGFWFERKATPFDEWYSSLFPEEESEFSQEMYERVTATRAHREDSGLPTPFIDVLDHGDDDQKRTVIALISKHFKPSFAPTLLRALQDKSNAIRVQAATAMARIENAVAEKSHEILKELEESPEDADLLLELAQHYDEYALTGLLDSARQRDYRHKAMEAYGKYLDEHPGDRSARTAMGRILVRKGRYSEAAEWFRQGLDDKEASPQAVLWLMECLFHLDRLDELRELATDRMKKWEGKDNLPEKVAHTVRLWAGETCEQVPAAT